MVLDFGLVGQPQNVQSSDYRSAGSHQIENLGYLSNNTGSTYQTIFTVPSAKTYYITGIVVAVDNATSRLIKLATGASGSESDFMAVTANLDNTFTMNFETPIKLSGGTRLSRLNYSAILSFVSIVGWQE